MNQMVRSIKNKVCLVLILFISVTSAGVKTWQPLGPSPIYRGQSEIDVNNAATKNPQVGAINAIAPHPTNANIIYVATVAGGIWKTENAGDPQPKWEALTDLLTGDFPFESLSTSDISFDPNDTTHSTLVASYGRYSSFNRQGGKRMGVIHSTDSGATWTKISSVVGNNTGITMEGKNINSVKVFRNVVLAAVDAADINACNQLGIFGSYGTKVSPGVSTATGLDWFQMGSSAGLIQGRAYALEADPLNFGTYYVGINKITCGGSQSGIYKTTDYGQSWNLINDAAINAVLNLPGCVANNHYKISVGAQNNVFVGIICDSDVDDGFSKGELFNVFRSGNGGSTWSDMSRPETTEVDGVKGLHPGGQGFIHRSIVADPTNPNIVYVGGDRQPNNPGSLGNVEWSGRIFRGDASLSPGSQWTALTHSGTAGNTAPHADSRDMMFDASGTLYESDDGGIYRMFAPRSSTSDWKSANGNIQNSEIHSSDYDSNSNTVIAGFQDNGTNQQFFLAEKKWDRIFKGDGGDVAVDAMSLSAQNRSIRYMSSQNLGGFVRRIFDQNNQFVSEVYISRTVINGGADFEPQFLTPIALNNVNPERLIIGGGNSIYESLDQGDTISEIGPGIIVPIWDGPSTKTIAYGNNINENILYISGKLNTSNGVFVRTTANGPLTFSYAATTGVVNGVVVNDNNAAEAFLVEDAKVMRTINSGSSWTEITGNIASVGAQGSTIDQIRVIEFIDGPSYDAVIVGTNKGIFFSTSINNYSVWARFGVLSTPVPFISLEYNKEDDILIAGTFGRGEYMLKAPLSDNDAPIPNPFELSMNLGMGGTSSNLSDGTTSLLDNFSAEDPGQTLTMQTTPIKEPTSGILTLNANGTFSYQHDGSFTDSDEFYYRVCDNGSPILCNDAKVNVTINSGNKVCSIPNLDIPDNNPTGLTNTLTMMQSGLITDIDVNLEINHTYVGDLTVNLVHVPSNTEVVLINRPGNNGCGADDISVDLDDAASLFADAQCATPIAINGHFKPTGTLSSYNGLELAGNWNLSVIDSANNDLGALISWCLEPEIDAPDSPPVLNPIGNQSVDAEQTLSFLATAIDPDTDQGNLMFSLNNEPTGASITTGGNFSFTPTAAQAPNTYTFDVIVTDDSNPPLSDSETIMVTVNEVVVDPAITVCSSPGAAIPDGTGDFLVNTLTIPNAGTVTDVDVSLDITHTWVGDLDVILTHVASGKIVQIIQNPGGSNCDTENIQARFSDEYTNTTNACEIINGNYQPVGTLSSFDGEMFPGDWNLTVSDSIAPDPGTLNSWCLHAVVDTNNNEIFKSGFEQIP